MQDAVGQIVIGKENLDGERKPTKTISMNGAEYRRSIYVQVRRTRTLAMFETFDAPTLSPNCDLRSSSTVTPQSLMMMNSEFIITYADAFANRILDEAGPADVDRITLAWRLAYGIRPTDAELRSAADFIRALPAELAQQEDRSAKDALTREAYAVFCQALLSSSRFLYVE